MGSELLHILEKTSRTVVFATQGLTEAIHLANRAFVMGQDRGASSSQLPRPHHIDMIGSESFGRLRNRIWDLIGEERG